MQDGQYLALQHGTKVDQHVTATDQVQPGERRVLYHVVPGENANFTDELGNLIPALRSGKEARQSLRRDASHRGLRVSAGPGLFDGHFADIGGENLERKLQIRLLKEFHQADGDRISLLTGGAPGYPDADRVLGTSILHQCGEHPLIQVREDGWFTKE